MTQVEVDFDTRLQHFIEKYQELYNAFYENQYKTLTPPTIRLDPVKEGQTFARVVTEDAPDRMGRPGQISVICFVALKDGKTKSMGHAWKKGDIFKAAGYKAPAKHVRGSIFNEDMFSCAGRPGPKVGERYPTWYLP